MNNCKECNKAELIYNEGQSATRNEPSLPDGWFCPHCGCTFDNPICKECNRQIKPHLRDAIGLCRICDRWLNIAKPTRIDDQWHAYHWSLIEEKEFYLGVVPERFRGTIEAIQYD